jgi:hypothetical protein
MSVNRLLLRLMAISALTANGSPSGGIWPTAAEDRVLDGRLDSIRSVIDEAGAQPVILVETPMDEGMPFWQGYKDDRKLDLVFEISLPVREDDGDAGFVIGHPYSDSERNASLDLIEAQIHAALWSSDAFKALVCRLDGAASALATDDTGKAIAIRHLRYQIVTWKEQVAPGDVPEWAAPALTLLEANPVLAARAAAIRARYVAPAAANAAIRLLLDRGWTRSTAEDLGSFVTEEAPVLTGVEIIETSGPVEGGS